MKTWRIPGHIYAQEVALKSGADVVVTSARLATARMRDVMRSAGRGILIAPGCRRSGLSAPDLIVLYYLITYRPHWH